MANEYQYQQHPHATARQHPTQRRTEHKAALSLNDKIGLFITTRVGSMWAAYVFFGLSLVSLPAALASGNVIVIVSWVAQTFLQLVLLPIIIVGQNIQAKSSEDRAVATYEDAGAILDEAREIQVHLGVQDDRLAELVRQVAELELKLSQSNKSN